MSQDQLLALVREAVEQGLASGLWLFVVGTICASAIGAFAGSYLKKKAELAALDEQFQTALLQLQQQTRAIEGIKAEVGKDFAESVESIKASLARDLEAFKIGLQDQLKRQSEILAFRYTRIFSALEEIGRLPATDYTYLRRDNGRFVQDKQLFGKVVEQATTRYGKVREIFERIRPLVDAALLDEADRKIEEAERQSNLLTQALYTNSDLPEGIDVVTLLTARRESEESICTLLSRQVAVLTVAAT
jgi:hypothetical protein